MNDNHNKNHQNLKDLHGFLTSEGYELPDYEEFESDMSKPQNLQDFYTFFRKEGYELPQSFSDFESDMGFGKQSVATAQPTSATTTTQRPVMQGAGVRPTAPWKETSAMPDDVAEKFAADEKKRQQATAEKKQHIGTPGDTGIIKSPFDALSGSAQEELNKKVTREEIEKTVPWGVYDPKLREQYIDKKAEEYGAELGNAEDWSRRYEEGQKAQKEHVADQVNTMLDNVEGMLSEYNKELKKDINKKTKTSIFDLPNITDIDQQASIFSDDYSLMTPEQAAKGEQLGMMTAAERKLKSLQRTIDEAQKHANDPNWFAEFGRGMGAGLTDVSTWDFGINELADANKIQKALEKYDRIAEIEANGGTTDEQMTPAEQALLDAVATEIVVNEYYGGDVSNWYKGGQSTAVSIPFMASMIVSPAMAAGRGASAAMARYITKRFASKVAKNAVHKAALKAAEGVAKASTRVGIDAASATLHTAMFNPASIEADTRERMRGQIKPIYDIEGNVRYGGRIGGDSEKVARRKAAVNAFIENESEMLGNYIPGLNIIFGNTKWAKRFLANKFVNNIAQMERRAQFHGFLPEVLEEIAGGGMNSWWVKDQTFDTDPVTGVFSEDNLSTIAISIGATTIAMGCAKLGGYGVSRAQLSATNKEASQLFGDEWSDLRERLQSDDMNEVSAAAEEIRTSDKYTEEQKKAAIKYASLYTGINAYEHMEANEVDVDAKNANDTYKSAYEDATSDKVRNDIAIMMEECREKVRKELGDEILQMMETEDPLTVKQTLEETQNLTTEQAVALADYVAAHSAVAGIKQRIEDDADAIEMQQRELYNQEKNDEDGALHPATMIVDGEPREVYVKNGLVTNEDGTIDAENSSETIVVYDPVEGKNKQVPPKEINSLGEVTTAEQFENTIHQQRADFIQKQQDAATGRFNPQPGQIINMPEGDAVVLATDGESVTMQMPDGTQKSASIADIQQIIDGVAMEDYRSRHPEAEQQPAEEQTSAEETPTMIEGKPDSYEQDMEVTVKDGDEEKKVYVTGQRARVTAKGYVEDPEGRFVEYYVPGENRMMYIHENDPEGRIVGYKPVEKPAEEQAETPAETTEQMPEQPTEAATEEVQQPEETTSISSVMPMKKVREKRNVLDADGNPVKDKNGRNKKEWVEEEAEDWYAATPEDAYTYLYDEAVAAGLKEKEADGIVKIMQEQAQKELADIKKQPEPVASSVMATLRLRNERDAQIEEAQSHVDYWKKVNSLRNRAIMERREASAAERRANETAEQKAQREAYEAEQAQRQAEAEAAERRRQEENEQKSAGNFEAPVEAPENMESVEGNKTSESPLAAAKRELKDDAEAMEILNNTEPQTLEEVASTLMRSGKNQIGINPEDFYRHTGYSPRDAEKFKFILSNNGVSISRLGEMVEAAARNEHIPFDENDANAGFNAVLKVLGDVRTQGEINSYITNNRIQQAREHHDAMLAQEDAYMAEQLGVTAAEYEAWVESMEEKAEAVKNMSDEEFNAIFGYDETLLNNENIQDNDRRAETDNGSTGEEGADALQEEQREGKPAGTSQDDTRGVGEDTASSVTDNGAAVETEFDKPLNTLAEVKAFMQSIGYDGGLSKVFTTDDGRKFVKYKANGVITPNIYFGETTKRDVLQQFHLYSNIMGVSIPAALEDEFKADDARRKATSDAIYATERDEIKNILTEAGVPFVDVIDSERGSRIVFTDKKNDNGNYTDWMDVSDPDQVRDDIEFIKARAERNQPTAEQPEPVEAVEVEEAEASKKVGSKIDDVGEKIGGARKDLAQKMSSKINLDADTFPKMFPKFDLKKMVEQGLDPKLATAVYFLRMTAQEEYKRKAKRQSKSTALGAAKFFAAYAKRFLENGDTNTNFTDEGWVFTDYGKKFIDYNLALFDKVYEKLGDNIFDLDLSGYAIEPVESNRYNHYYRRNKDGVEEEIFPAYNARAKYSSSSYYMENELDKAIEELTGKISEAVSYKESHPYELRHYYNPGKKDSDYVGVKIGGKIVPLTDTMPAKDLRRYMEEHEAELQEKARRIDEERKQGKKEGGSSEGRWKPELNLGGKRSRVGEDYRNGRDVTADEFRDTFGFRGVEFGNYVTQKERQKFLNEAYDALLDLAALLDVSPKALSLGGQLGFAIGARGGGKNAAHYEPELNVINLTKTQGAGALAHEWWHALDYYFNREGDKRKTPAMANKMRSWFKPGQRDEIIDAFVDLVKKINDSDYFKRSVALETKLHPNKMSTGYYDNPTELGARAFQDYVQRRLTDRGQVNDFLSSFTPEEKWNGENRTYPYPTGDEANEIDEKFDKLFSTMQEKTDEAGNVLLYHKANANEEVKPIDKAAKAVIKKLDELLKKIFGNAYHTDLTEGQKKIMEMGDSIQPQNAGPVFVSNAVRAVEAIKQDKAPAEQWLKMIEKLGGLKAGEDKWIGLSEWLNDHNGKSLTKQEVMDYIRENAIEIEEVEYDNNFDVDQYFEETEDGWKFKGDDSTYIKLSGATYLNGSYYGAYHDLDTAKRRLATEKGIKDVRPIDDTRLQYTTKGLQNKREIALTVPTIEPWNERDVVHFGDAGDGRAVAWIRFGETTDANGKRVLVIDEIQSKRHQQGREKGYRKESTSELIKKQGELERRRIDMVREFQKTHPDDVNNEAWDAFVNSKEYKDILKEESETEDKIRASYNLIPDAPFDKNWHEVAFKRILRYAAENGFDKVAWTKGEQQVERYDLSKQVEKIVYKKNADGTYHVTAIYNGFGHPLGNSITEDKLSDVVGKELAKKIVNGEGVKTPMSVKDPDNTSWESYKTEEWNGLSGGDLRVGGEGMKGFYDQILPRFADKYGKKWNVKTTDIDLPNIGDNGLTMHSVDVTPEMKASVLEGQPMFQRGYHGSAANFDRFDHSHMGEGEGNQSFGYGTYVTQVEGIGRHYAEAVGGQTTYKGSKVVADPYSDNPADRALFYMQQEHGRANAIKFLRGMMEQSEDATEAKEYKETIDTLLDEKNWGVADKYLYIVDIPNDNLPNTEKPLSKKERMAIADAVRGHEVTEMSKGWLRFRTIDKEDRRKVAALVRELPEDALDREHHWNLWLPGGIDSLANSIERGQLSAYEIYDKIADATNRDIAFEITDKSGIWNPFNALAREIERNNTTIRQIEETLAELVGAKEAEEIVKPFIKESAKSGNEGNYIQWDAPLANNQINAIKDALLSYEPFMVDSRKQYDEMGGNRVDDDFPSFDEWVDNHAWVVAQSAKESGQRLYRELTSIFGSQKAASDFLHTAGFTGIKYPAQYLSGGRRDGAKNYVIFDENDVKITNKIKFFRTPHGTAYGFTVDGEIYIDPNIATSETRVHEYAHLWAQDMRDNRPDEWEQLKSEMLKEADVVAKVKELYPELIDKDNPDVLTDRMIEEVFAHYSGKRGAERLEADMREEMAKTDSIFEKARIANVFHKIREILRKFWNMVRDRFAGKAEGVENMSSEDFADKMLSDLLNEYDPRGVKDADIRFRKATSIEEVKDEILREFELSKNEENGDGRRIFIGKITGEGRDYLEKMFGVKIKPNTSFILNSSDLRHIYKDHYGSNEKDKGNNIPLTDDDIRNLVDVITSPDKIIFGIDKKEGRKMFFFFKNNNNGTYNLTEVYANSSGNLTTKSYLKTKRTISQRIDDLFTSPTLTSVTGGASSFQDAKIPTLFETAKNNLQNAGNNTISYQKASTYTTSDGVQLSMMSLFEGDVNNNDNLNEGDNANGDITNLRLRKLQPGETCHVERRYEESKQFSFIGKEKIESMDDVAYIFKQLETAAVENSFVVLVKDGKPTIIHTGMGSYTEATVDFKQAFAAYKEIQPDAVYVVHNHPSGTLKASKPDYSMLSTARRFFGSNVVKDGIIIDTVSGKYCTFGWSGDNVETMPESADGEMPVKVYQFSKQVFGPDWKPLEAIRFFDSRGIAEFVSSHRLGEHPKMSFIVVNKQNQVVGNYFLPWTSLNEIKDIEAACAEMSNYINLSGGTNGVLYGNYEYSEKDRRKLQKLTEEMRALGMSLLDVVHVDVNDSLGYHSAHDSGVMEPESKYEVPAREAGESLIDYAKRVDDDYNAYEAIVKAIDAANSSKVSEPVTDQDVIERLEAEPKIKVYRSMQLIDGKLYPPMSAKVEGQLRQPSNIGEWEQSEEMPDMVDENGKFKLDKGNKKSLKAAYNPYIHGATTMLNDQFSEAQDRPNLVVVEMEVPVSELTSGYRAEKAKDSVGMIPWKAGVIQGKLTGKRDVMLSRWAKPVRIVPVEEVAENIANQIEGQIDVMPSNVVTPQVRKALENLGVKFVETDNTGKIKDGENKGKTWASVYGKNLDKVEKKETASIENKVEEAIKGGYKIPKRKSGEGLIDYAQRISEEYSEYAADNGIATVHDDGTEAIDDRGMDMQERMTAMATRLSERNKKDAQLKYDAYRAIGSNLADLRKAMSLQKEFDKNTVKRVADLARILISGGYFADATKSELSRLLSAVKNATGKSDISSDIRKIMDVMIENQLRNAKNALEQMEKVKASKVDAKGVEVQGALDVAGQQMMKTFKETRGWSEEELADAMAKAQERMGSEDAAVAEEAANEYAGLQVAMEYAQNIHGSVIEERELQDELADARRATDRSREYEDTLLEAIRQNKMERVQAYYDLMARLSGSMRESIANAKAFKEAEKERVREIQHNANSDMEGRPSDEHYKPEWKDKMVNNSFVQFLFSPLATFDQMMRLFGSKSANGEGYLYNRFMRGWVDAREKELRGVREKYAVLDEKVHQLFGNDAKSMADLIRLTGRMPKATVLFKDGGEMKEHQLTQGNMMYIYMVNKMLDGRMKLRKMGIDEKAVSEMMRLLDPRLKELADWMQEEFLVDTRNEYNETHKRLFGAPMAAIEHYFPLKINANARVDKAEDLDDFDKNEGISTKTGSIIKRRMNALALDVTNADALNVILDHVAQMEHWNAFAEFNRDLNTLRTYKRFRNQVKNMTTIYGSGDKLWEKFNDMSQMVAGTYRPKRANLDVAATNVAKGVTAAKVSFRIFTALKQFLSMPAYIPDARPDLWAKNLATPWKSWSWAMENLPIFEERWKSRIAGDPRLLKSELDWKGWRNNVVQLASKIGMSPNAFVDALTVSIGAKTIYESRKERYMKEGYSEEQADKRAKQDAEVAYNQTQQSSEGAFLSTMQVDRSWLSVMFTVFRNSSMAYQRQLHDAIRNLKRDMKKGNREESIEFMKKQMVREGVPEDKAEEAAKERYNRQVGKDVLRVATFGYILQFCWNLGAVLPYLLFGGDDDKKDQMWDDVFAKSFFGWGEGLTGGDVMSEAGKMAVQGKGNPEYLKKEMPAVSDAYKVLQEIGQGKYGEVVNDMVNLVVQAGVGVNPQSITDAVLAIMDACGNDPKLAHEATIAIMRILQVPQSQIKEMYFDEIGLSGDEVSKYTPAQLAERYAKYQVKRGRMIEPWTWNDEGALAKQTEKANKAIKERVENIGGEEANEAYNKFKEQYDEYAAKLKEYKKSEEYRDATPMEKAQWLNDYYKQDPQGYINYSSFKDMDAVLNKMVGYYLGSHTAKEAQACYGYIEGYKQAMVDVLSAESDEARKAAREKRSDIVRRFYDEVGNMQKTGRKDQKMQEEYRKQMDKMLKNEGEADYMLSSE